MPLLVGTGWSAGIAFLSLFCCGFFFLVGFFFLFLFLFFFKYMYNFGLISFFVSYSSQQI